MKTKKIYSIWVKGIFAVIFLLSLTVASISGVLISYGMYIGAFNEIPFSQSNTAYRVAQSGILPSYQWDTEKPFVVDMNFIAKEPAMVAHNNAYPSRKQTMYELYTYYGIRQGQPVQAKPASFYEEQYQNSNLRARAVIKDAQGNVMTEVCRLGGIWDGNTVLADRVETTKTNPVITFEIGFDRTLSNGTQDKLGKQGFYYNTLSANQTALFSVLFSSILCCLLSGIALLLLAGHSSKDEKIHLSFFDRWPFAISQGIILFSNCAIWFLADAMHTYVMYGINVWSTFLLSVMVWSSAFFGFLALRTTAVRIKARCFWTTTLCYYLYNFIHTRIQKAAAKRQAKKQSKQKLLPDSEPVRDSQESHFSVQSEKMQENVRELAEKTQKGVHRLAEKTQGAVHHAMKKAKTFEWNGSLLQRILHKFRGGICRIAKIVHDLFSRLSVIGQGMLFGLLAVSGYLLSSRLFSYPPERLLATACFSVLVLIGLYAILMQFERLQKDAQQLAAGNLTHKIDTKHLHGAFRTYAENLNQISAGMMTEVARRMKSEHLKTELLTNVSHDIKTPLTSIINYVDLLKKQEVQPDEAKEYVEVLERQAQRLKKLLEDLIEASKAATGNITAELAPTDAAELLRQAEGEYNERLKEQQLIPVLRMNTETCSILTDGRLLWRVFDNLLGNIVKYAMPGTRVYMELLQKDDRCVITIRNISRDELGIEAEELMERFVRGDAARATEGSGLGLSIARSLTECMNGGFDLVLDGDLFKVILDFPLI